MIALQARDDGGGMVAVKTGHIVFGFLAASWPGVDGGLRRRDAIFGGKSLRQLLFDLLARHARGQDLSVKS